MYGCGEDEEFAKPPDSDEEDEQLPPLRWKSGFPVPETLRLLVVVENESAAHFARECLVGAEPPVDSVPEARVHLHRLPGDVLVCLVGRGDDSPAEVVRLLAPFALRAARTIAFQTLPLAAHKSALPKDKDVVRTLTTEKEPAAHPPRLESPNFAVGAAAGVLNLCDCAGRPCSLFLFYSEADAFGLDDAGVRRFRDILAHYGITDVKKYAGKKITNTTYM